MTTETIAQAAGIALIPAVIQFINNTVSGGILSIGPNALILQGQIQLAFPNILAVEASSVVSSLQADLAKLQAAVAAQNAAPTPPAAP